MGPNSYKSYLSNDSYRYGQVQYFITYAEEPNIKYAFVARLNLGAKYLSVDPCLQISYFMEVERCIQCSKVTINSFHKMAGIENKTKIGCHRFHHFLMFSDVFMFFFNCCFLK